MDRNRKYNLNEQFFEKINTEEQAYWLGFLYADGCILERKIGQSALHVKLAETEPLIKLAQSLKTNRPIATYVSQNGYNIGKLYHTLTIVSDKIVQDLRQYGCVPRKSLTLKFPNNLPEFLVSHFIRGYF